MTTITDLNDIFNQYWEKWINNNIRRDRGNSYLYAIDRGLGKMCAIAWRKAKTNGR